MKPGILTITIFTVLTLHSCKQITKQEAGNGEASKSKTEKITNLLLGSWVEPNPINEKEVQGFIINGDGTAESINMATLLYKKWWKESDKLVLVSESIGNGSSGTDTIEYEIVKLNEKELEIKDRNYTRKYKKQ